MRVTEAIVSWLARDWPAKASLARAPYTVQDTPWTLHDGPK